MTFITLTFTKSTSQILADIPEFVSISSSSPASIYYTVDGTLPTQFSTPYEEPSVQMPTSSASVTLSAVAYFLDGYDNLTPSSVFSETYSTTEITADRVRNLSFEGISYMYPGGLNIPFWYDSDGNPSVYIDIPLEEFEKELIPSERNVDGSTRSGVDGGVAPFIPVATNHREDDDFTKISSPEGNAYFDPEALLIVIDGRNPRNADDVLLINSSNMSLRNPEKNFSGVDFRSTGGSNYISGGLTKAHYNREKGIIVFYYFDSNSGRWIKSIQNLPAATSQRHGNAVVTNPVVFEWNLFGRHQNV